jgi:hypothetical protein
MQKRTIIKNIKRIINDFGSFNLFELGAESSPCVGTLGNFVGLAESFNKDEVDVSVYDPSSASSDPIDEYTIEYEKLDKDVLSEILIYCEEWEAECLKTEKRISN